MAAKAAYSSGGTAGPPGKHQEVLTAFRGRFKHAQSHWSDWRTEARELYDLMAGHQWNKEDEARMKDELRPMVTFNVAGKYMDAVVGLQINNRQQTTFLSRRVGTAQTSELMTGAVEWARDLCNQADEETDSFYDCIVTGLGWIECFLDKDLEADGVPAGRRVDPMEMYPDPGALQRNLEDARYIIRIRWMDHEDYEEIFGEKYEEPSDREFDTLDVEDEEVEVVQIGDDYTKEPGQDRDNGPKLKKCPVADYQFWKREERMVVSAEGIGEKDMSLAEFEKHRAVLEQAQASGAPVQIKKIRRKVYYKALISGSKVGKYGLSPYQGGFTYHAITGKRDRNKRTWYGIGRSVLDPQRWVNKFFSTILFTLMTNAKGGIMAEEGAFKDAKRAESEWAKPDSITWVKSGALAGGQIEPKPIAKYPDGLDRLMEFSMQALPQTSGLNLELMGLADRVQAGVVEAQRKQSAMAIIAWAFDAMRRYYRSVGRQQARYVIDYVPEGTLVLINGKESKQYIPLIKSQIALKFDVIVDESPTSANLKERVWMVLETIIPTLIKAGIKIPPEVLDYSPLPAELAQKWKQQMQPSPEEQKAQQRGQEAELGKAEAEVQEKQSEAQLNLAKAQQALADAGQQPADQNAELQAEIGKAKIKADADTQIAQLKAAVEMQVAKMKAELEAQTKIQIAQMQAAITAQLQQQQMGTDAQLQREQMSSDSSLKREELAHNSQIESDRIKSTERVGKAKVKASSKPKASK
jgi:hypothetical protein